MLQELGFRSGYLRAAPSSWELLRQPQRVTPPCMHTPPCDFTVPSTEENTHPTCFDLGFSCGTCFGNVSLAALLGPETRKAPLSLGLLSRASAIDTPRPERWSQEEDERHTEGNPPDLHIHELKKHSSHWMLHRSYRCVHSRIVAKR